ncbi:MAG: DHHA1 domain-containing protein, partial [Calditrichia bacterium]
APQGEVQMIHSKALARVDPEWRYPTMCNHTATHLLQAALRKVLGDHVQQAGSLVAPDRLRFDFSHYKKIEPAELQEIEMRVNRQIWQNEPLEVFTTSYDKAREKGAMALFGEKYGDQVRVVSIKDISMELCGGTHVRRTGEIGSFLIMQESSIASGVRRIEAITGPKALVFSQMSRDVIFELQQQLNTTAQEIPGRIRTMGSELKEMERQLHKLRAEQVLNRMDDLAGKAEKIGNINFAVEKFTNMEIDQLKLAGDKFRQKVKNGVLLLVNITDNKLTFVCAVTDDLIRDKKLQAGKLVSEVAGVTGGGGGGRPHLATAGGKNLNKLDNAVNLLREKLKALSN